MGTDCSLGVVDCFVGDIDLILVGTGCSLGVAGWTVGDIDCSVGVVG